MMGQPSRQPIDNLTISRWDFCLVKWDDLAESFIQMDKTSRQTQTILDLHNATRSGFSLIPEIQTLSKHFFLVYPDVSLELIWFFDYPVSQWLGEWFV